MKLNLVKGGIKGIAFQRDFKGNHNLNKNFYVISYDLKSNEGYIQKKGVKNWKLYTQIGQKIGERRKFYFNTFESCVEKLKELKGDDLIYIYNPENI
ncbi:hypothetical protein [uncultured Polaribacter sp.]|uniref:hypothetical protein n=1 Tax=uncultured Polaribacter sp. TaxID=174711 RepID=UPI002634DFA6|nr:hypothetical protein [uncultured Polaribacter sp.]